MENIDNNLIKILVGPRGSGKTTIFTQFINNLKINKFADDFHIININFDFLENAKLKDKNKLDSFLRKKITDNKMYYIFLDEIHCVDYFEEMLIEFNYAFLNVNIFISSSNSRLLTEDLNSSMIGKFRKYFVTPLSYSETCDLLNTEPQNKNMLLNFLKYGSFPSRFECKKTSEVKLLLYSLLDSIYLRDVVLRLGLKDIDDMSQVLKYVVKYLGKDVTLFDLQNEIVEQDEIMPEYRFFNAIDSLCRALIIRASNDYDVVNEDFLRGTHRYYLCDLGIAFLYNFDFQNNLDAILKNWMWIELKRRNYKIYTGINGKKTFDFVAIKNGKKMYIQVIDELKDGNSVNIEVDKLEGFEEPSQRYLLSLDKTNYSRKGVLHKNIVDFVLKDLDKIDADDSLPNWVCVE